MKSRLNIAGSKIFKLGKTNLILLSDPDIDSLIVTTKPTIKQELIVVNEHLMKGIFSFWTSFAWLYVKSWLCPLHGNPYKLGCSNRSHSNGITNIKDF